jgi:hypothetical protein
MYNRVIFYLHFGNGDIFESREFVKEWMKLVPAKEYFYAHGKHPRILLDIPELKFMQVTEHMNPMKDVWDDLNGNLYVNCWIGRDGKYVLPGIGCTVEKLYEMHNDMLSVYGFGELSGKPIDYIPTINYKYYNIENATKFLLNRVGELIFIDNGNVQSMQAENFDMSNVIKRLATNHMEKTFIVTHKFDVDMDNIIPADYITKQPEFDLPEISYISLFCSTLIGRNSGPHVFTQVNQNAFDGGKKLLSFTYEPSGASFIVNSDVYIRRYWSNSTSEGNVLRDIERVINE